MNVNFLSPLLAFSATLVFLLAGCSSPKIIWTKKGSTLAEFRRDKYECIQESRVSWSGGGSGDIGLFMMLNAKSNAEDQSKELFQMCMEARGYMWHVKHEDEEMRN